MFLRERRVFPSFLGVFFSLQVFVMTPEILYQNLHHRFMTMESIELLIFDECHHARKHHRYACIMQVCFVFSSYAWLVLKNKLVLLFFALCLWVLLSDVSGCYCQVVGFFFTFWFCHHAVEFKQTKGFPKLSTLFEYAYWKFQDKLPM